MDESKLDELEKQLQRILKEYQGLFEVYEPETNKVILVTDNYWEANAALYRGNGLYNSTRNARRVRKIKTKAAEVLYGSSEADED